MKNKVIVIMCLLMLTLPASSFTDDQKEPYPNVSGVEQADENASFDHDKDEFNNKVNEEIRAKRPVDKEEAEAKNKEKKASDKGEGISKESEPSPSVSAHEHANKNAKFKRDGKKFNTKENKKIREKKLAEKEEMETKKTEEKAQDKGEGQVKVKF